MSSPNTPDKAMKASQLADLQSDIRRLLNSAYTGFSRMSGQNLLASDLWRVLQEDVEDVAETHRMVKITQGKYLEHIITLTLPPTKAARTIQLALMHDQNFSGDTVDGMIVLTSPEKRMHEGL